MVRLGQNIGHKALWASGVGDDLHVFDGNYVYTDPDILPVASFPPNFAAIFLRILMAYPTANKVGCALKIDDLPNSYRFKAQVVEWEEEFWSDWRRLPLPPVLSWLEQGQHSTARLFQGDIDTTFALYRQGQRSHSYGPAIRVSGRLAARHLPWYADSSRPTAEEAHYRATARESGFWTRTTQGELAQRMAIDPAGGVQGPGRTKGP